MNAHTEIQPQLTTAALAAALMSRLVARPSGRIFGSGGSRSFENVAARVAMLVPELSTLENGPVAICATKRPDTIAGILATLVAGRAYAPLDPAHPDARILAILDGLAPAAVLVDSAAALRLSEWSGRTGIRLVRLDAVSGQRTGAIAQGETAAVLHTSGSTGVPKQVRIGARAIEAFAEWVRAEFLLGPDDCVLSHAPLAFDLSFLDVFAALHAGADIVLADAAAAQNGEKLLHLIADGGVTFVHAAPSALALVTAAADGRMFRGVRAVLFAGEPMPSEVLAQICTTFPQARIVNIYGCTETNDTFFYDVPRHGAPDPLPLGRPLPHTDFVITTEAGLPVAPGEAGELWVRCATMMDGYSDAAATEAAFAIHCGQRFFRSRDRVRLGPDGLVHFLGRVDSVVKIRGNRIDLSEVENCLSGHPDVAEAAVFVTGCDTTAQLEAAVTLRSISTNSLALRRHAMKALPAYAIPKRFDLTTEPLPRNSNGKICRRMLAARAEGAPGPVPNQILRS